MLKFLLYFNIALVLVTLNESKFYKRGHLNDNSLNGEAPWPNLWFPYPPNYENKVKPEINNVSSAPEINVHNISDKNNSSNYPGLWFPHPPNYQGNVVPEVFTKIANKNSVKSKTSDGQELWFPLLPNYEVSKKDKQSSVKIKNHTEKIQCDNGKDNIGIDFDPDDKRHSFNYLCFGNRSDYEPNFNTSALMREYVIPAAYEPPLKCINENIEYPESIPTYGAFRPLAPKFGSYKFLPPQRWLHSLADGAIILLYHPCAFAGQIELLQNTLKGCLYRHIITPSQQLTPQRPLALLAWGKILQMSVVDDNIVIKFVKENAKMGFRQKRQKLEIFNMLYDAGLLNEAHLVTDEQDVEICGYKEMR